MILLYHLFQLTILLNLVKSLNDYRSRNFHLLIVQRNIFHFQIPDTKKAQVFHWSITCANFFLHDGGVFVYFTRMVVSKVAVNILVAIKFEVAAIIIN